MLKRVTKVTSLLIAAASIVSMVPAMAAEYQEVEAKDGVIYDASSKGGGVFLIDGEINGDENRAIYLLKDGKYTKLEDAETGDKMGDICQGKYLEMTRSGSGVVYYVDITTGKESDDYSRVAENQEIAMKLKNKIKKDNDGRFSEENFDSFVTPDTTVRGDGSGEETMWGISGSWRQYLYKLDKPFSVGNYTKDTSTIYSDPQGNYIDVDYNLGSIVVATTTESSVTVKNTSNSYKIKENDKYYEIKAQIKNDRTWDEGPDAIVRTAKLTIWKKEVGQDDSSYVNVTDEVKLGAKAHFYKQAINDDNSVTILQKISKAQASDNIDGIKYAKDVKTYFITDEDGKPQPLLGLGNGLDDVYRGFGLHAITGGTQGYNVSFYYDFVKGKVYAETLNYKSKNGYNYIDVDEYDETNVEKNGFKLGCGDVWALGDRYVKRFNDKDNKFEKLYKVDGGMTNLHSSLPTDIVVWGDSNTEGYSIVYPKAAGEEKKDAVSTVNTTTGAAVVAKEKGWTKNSDGTWNYIKADGTKAIGWYKDGAAWYYLKTDGVMATGWQNVDGKWYYLNESGAMQTGWIKENGKWYYCNTSGEMLAGTVVDGYVLGVDGTWVK